MKQDEWERIVKRYTHPILKHSLNIRPDIQADIERLIDHARALTLMYYELQKEHTLELHGAKATMMALCQQLGGEVEIPFSAVEGLADDAELDVKDIENEVGNPRGDDATLRGTFRGDVDDAVFAEARLEKGLDQIQYSSVRDPRSHQGHGHRMGNRVEK